MEREVSIKEALDFAVEKHNQGNLREAEEIYKKVLEKQPDNPNALHLLGLIMHQSGKNDEAINLIKKAISFNPSAMYYGNLGMIYDFLGNEEKSAECFEKALEINPNYGNAHLAHYNLGVFYKEKGEFEEALTHFDRAIEIDKNFYDARWNRSLVLLLLGRFKEGWEEYEYRFKKKSPTDSRIFNKPKWNGEQLSGKRILIVSEQGFGDNIQFIRYAKLIKEKEAYVILECRKELVPLFKQMPEIDEIVEKKANAVPKIDFDFYIHLMSLPRMFNTEISTIPNKISYLKTDKILVDKFSKIIRSDKFKIGIVWAGNPKQEDDWKRSVAFDKFRILLGISGIEFFSLQKEIIDDEIEDLEITDLSEYLYDFADTAAIIENLDLVISVDTSVAHLAGALGKPTWILLSHIPDWRWMLNRNDSPWYPSTRLFRQPKPGDWDSVFREVEDELIKLTEKYC